MKCVYVISCFPKASETFILREIEGLKCLGHEIFPVSFEVLKQKDIANLSSLGSNWQKLTHYVTFPRLLPFLPLALWWLIYFKTQKKSIGKLLDYNARSVIILCRSLYIINLSKILNANHIHAHWPYSSIVTAFTHEIAKIPYSISVHAHEVAHQNEHFPFIFPSLRFASFCNEAAMKMLLGQIPENYHSKAHLIYHGVNLKQFDFLPMPSVDSNTSLKIISSGRLTPTKGFDRLIKACAKAKESGIDLELTILGSASTDTTEKYLIQLAKELNFSQHLKLTGWVPFSEVSNYMGDSHIFALLADTNFHDGLPNVVLEAMSSGRPVILSPFPAVQEAVTNNEEGYVLKHPEDYETFVFALKQMRENNDKLCIMGQNARQKAVILFDENVHLKHLSRLFENQFVE